MKVRILTAAVMLALFVPVLWFSHLPVLYPLSMALLSAVGAFELLRCLGLHRDLVLSLPAVSAVAAIVFFSRSLGSSPREPLSYLGILAACFFLLLLYFFLIAVLREGKLLYGQLMGAVGGCLYITLAFSSMVLLRDTEKGVYLFLLPFIGSWVCDTFAYFVGRLFGRHKLSPVISPKKTVEGSLGGIAFSVGAFALYGAFLSGQGISPNYPALLAAGLAVSVVSQIGDLSLSAIKREYGIKDYSHLFPGHGGVLDRFDSVIATAPLILFFCLCGGSFSLFL